MSVKVGELPSSVRVGAYDIKITLTDALPDAYGEFVAREQEIKLLREYVSAPLAVDSLIHELLHAAFWAAALPRKYEERIVSGLAPVLTQVLTRDHPELLEWLASMAALRAKPAPESPGNTPQ